MSASVSLDEKFNAAVKAIQRLPNDGERIVQRRDRCLFERFFLGTFQTSNEMKLTFYGLYKQATVGPCTEPRPSMFNYIARAKW